MYSTLPSETQSLNVGKMMHLMLDSEPSVMLLQVVVVIVRSTIIIIDITIGIIVVAYAVASATAALAAIAAINISDYVIEAANGH